jgi:16S rRNA A1518/A1519 N6-dimethyltransferase RsmA/KsgA/DIM1 with predicted DNA glycosylase/AP lyase activity
MLEGMLIVSALFVLTFGLVVLRGAPYLPTLRKSLEQALDLLELKEGDTLLELGSGDGRMLRLAAERGIYSIGYELNPLLVLWTRIRHWRYRRYITVKWADFWLADWPPSDGMYVFLLDRYMSKLHKSIIHYIGKRSYKVVSNSFMITEKKPKKSLGTLYLYTYCR